MKEHVINIPITPTMDMGASAARDFKEHNGYKIDRDKPKIDACLLARTPFAIVQMS